MPSPVGHSLLAISIALLQKKTVNRSFWGLLVFAIFSGNAADLDFLPGLMIGDANRFHHGASHSLGSAAIYALLCFMVAFFIRRQSAWQYASTGFIFYCSHLLADSMTADARSPFGIPLFWPLSERYLMFENPLLRSFSHGDPGLDTADVLLRIFSWHNVLSIGLELLVFVPVLLLVTIRRHRIT